MKCPNCSKDLSAFSQGSAYCPYCGQALGDQDTNRLLFCPYCGQELSAPADFCPHCGKNLVPTKAKPPFRPERVAATIARSLKGRFGRERKIKKLFQHWAEYDQLPPDEIPSVETMGKVSEEGGIRKQRPQRLYILLALAAIVLIAGIIMVIIALT
ncbi:MAG: zinc ribbon domain-containing protein [Dehalococcoidales bacterium]